MEQFVFTELTVSDCDLITDVLMAAHTKNSNLIIWLDKQQLVPPNKLTEPWKEEYIKAEAQNQRIREVLAKVMVGSKPKSINQTKKDSGEHLLDEEFWKDVY